MDLIVYEYHQTFAYTYVRVAPQASCVPPEAWSEQSPDACHAELRDRKVGLKCVMRRVVEKPV